MDNIKAILQDIILEAQTTSRWLEHGDIVIDSFEYIENLAKIAIEKIDKD